MQSSPISSPLTSGSFKEVFKLSLPLMLTFMSSNLMFVVSRWILSWYSLDAMNSVGFVSTFIAIFQFAPLAITSISEVFVGRYNGARDFERIGAPVWQMIWLTGFLIVPYLLLSFSGEVFIPKNFHDHGLPYFKIEMILALSFPLMGALAGYYAGRGQVKILTASAFVANALNAGLSYYLVFGIEDLIPPMGTLGAALSNVIAATLQLFFLFLVFLRPSSQKHFGTNKWRFNKSLFFDCLKIGVPNAISHITELSAWIFLSYHTAALGMVYVTVASVTGQIFVMFNFLIEGIQKAVIALVSNFIGANKLSSIKEVIKNSLKLHAIIASLLALPLLVFSKFFICLFLHDDTIKQQLMYQIQLSCFFVWLHFVCDGLVWIIAGVLTAAGDSRYTMFTNAANVWFCSVLPVYVAVFVLKGDPYLIWGASVFYGISNAFFFYRRYKSGKWKQKIKLSDHAV